MTRRGSLRVANLALSSALLARATKAHIPGDAPEDHEDNTYGLPEGALIRKKLRRYFRDQLKRVVGFVAEIGAEIPHSFPSMADYTDAMASAMTPILGVYWDKAGKGLRGRLGLDPDEWRVTDPNVHRAIADQALKFCRKTNATTDLGIAEARDAVRDMLARGLIGEGESVEQLTSRIKQVFTRATGDHARMIAQTEASRAVHAASEMSAIASGVCSTKRILLSAHSCPTCVRVAEQAGSIPLGTDFATIGRDPTYSSIRMPPIHPRCRCSVLYDEVDAAKPPVSAFTPEAPKTSPKEKGATGKPRRTATKPRPAKPNPAPKPPPPPQAPLPAPPPIVPQQSPGPIERAIARGSKAGIPVSLGGKTVLMALGKTELEVANCPAFYLPTQKMIFINEHHEAWKSEGDWMRRKFDSRWLSSPAADHVITHEIGHALHHRELGNTGFDDLLGPLRALGEKHKKLIGEQVGAYATTNAAEAVAEIYAGIKGGRTYGPEVMAYYHNHRGPRP